MIIHCRGRLGNQLFQIAAGFALAEKLSRKCLVVLPRDQNYSEDQFTSITDVAELSQCILYPGYTKRVFWKLIFKVRFLLPKVSLGGLVTELGPHDIAFRLGRSVHLYGYFADCRYALQSGFLQREFTLAKPSVWFSAMINKAKTTEFVAIHVRRGDYVLNAERWGLLDVRYYEEALKRLPLHLQRKEIWVFSDDPYRAKQVLSSLSNYTFVFISPPKQSNPIESLLLMTLGAGHVLANSTFGYWGALLSSTSQWVIFPDRSKQGDAFVTHIPNSWIPQKATWE